MRRRSFLGGLLGCTALVAVPSAVLAYDEPPLDAARKARRGYTMALGKALNRNRKKLPKGGYTSGPVGMKAKARTIGTNINQIARQRAAARAAAGAAERRAVAGLVSGMARLGGRANPLLRLAALAGGAAVVWAGSNELYKLATDLFGREEQVPYCDAGTICLRKQNDGSYKPETTSVEMTTSQSSWSLYGTHWHPYKYVSRGTVNGVWQGYTVHWIWKENSKPWIDFDPDTDYAPYVKGVALTDVQTALANKGLLQEATDVQTMADLAAHSLAGAHASDPTELGDFGAEMVAGAQLDISGLSDSFADTFTQPLSAFLDPLPDLGDGTAEAIDLDLLEDVASDGIAEDEEWWQGGSGPDPSSGGGSGSGGGGTTPADCLPGSAACPASVDWGTPPADPLFELPAWEDWLPNPFSPPDLSASCRPFVIEPGVGNFIQLDPINIDLCQFLLIDEVATTAFAVGSLGSAFVAGKVLLDV